MSLYVENIPNPPAGQDWSYTVPGQYVEDVVSVTATLTTLANPTTATDSSGNANDATYAGRAGTTYGVVGPFGGGGLAVQTADNVPENQVATFPNAGGALDTATFTVEAIVWIDDLGGFFSFEEILSERDLTAATRFIIGVQYVNPTAVMRIAASQFDVFNLGTSFANNSWHHLAVTYAANIWTPYLDGVAGVASGVHALTTTVHNQPVAILGDGLGAFIQYFQGKAAAVAYYGGVLSGAQIAAHQAAIATSAAAYKAAVLADSPVALWMLDQTQSTSGRTPSLRITNGTITTGLYTPGFPAAGSGSPFTYSWLTGLNTSTHPAGASTITAAIPDLILPPGYTIGTSTPDIVTTDQWSNITIWWDDRYQTSQGGIPFDFTNRLLVK